MIVHRQPNGLEMEREATVREIQDWFVSSLGLSGWKPPVGTPGADLVNRIRNEGEFRNLLSPIFNEMMEGDALWICRSRVVGPLLGHRGIALVREGRTRVYVQMINY